ncbi:LytTR family DNA-binding domain-containing protein [Clostridium pasteurianum]|uniref:Response regulator of the LytR/AlgR family n=1 Tax=Clostridium pasteurianum BC1 TaxID=86416 RepID=R4K9W9_CLOPA|nr:LytTR family DNA-binding domain-containing protein [Clostridium pasteurianum]AGK98476.1 response regulator of the LytR/AlgR family [Clostridium pasteurianum BC1]
MKVEVILDADSKEPRIVVYTDEITNEIQQIVDNLSNKQINKLVGLKEQKIFLLNPDEIYCFYSENQKIFAKTDKDVLCVKQKLYELEEKFKGTSFVRVSNSCIVNISKINNLELSYSGTIQINFKNNDKEFVSRRYVSKIKKYLGI